MATPTPSQPLPNPTSASKRPNTAHNVSTPLGQGTSPLQQQQQPRSHPSPTATRTAAKTPINHPTASSTKTLGGTPMVQTLSQQGFGTVSPSGAMGLNGTPSGMGGLGLGVDLMGTPGAMGATPSGMNMGMAMGMGMVPSMSELGLSLTTSGGQKRNEDEERRARMRRIIKKIGGPRGRVSEEGIARVGRRVGFANDIDAEVLTAEERERKVGNRTVSIAGEAVVVDVDMKNHVPREVQVMLSGEGEGLAGMAEKAGEVLLQSLKNSNKLDGFAKGLDWIAKIDRVGGGKVNGFEALGGVFGCLRKLFEEEVRLVEESGVGGRDRAEVTATRKKGGRPVAHERGELGISLDYWQDDHNAASNNRNGTAMDVDSDDKSTSIATPPGLRTLHLDLDRCPPEMYPPIRISSTWLPETLTLDATTPIPWQDPKPTFLTSPGADDTMADSNQQPEQERLLPSLRFLARLDPPIILPWQTATALLTTLNAPAPQTFGTPPLLHQLLIPAQQPSATEIEHKKTVLARRSSGSETKVEHVCRLHIAKPDFGFKLDELPFAHPRQLVESLPVLRQWGCFGALMQDVFSSTADSTPQPQLASNGISSNGKDSSSATTFDTNETSQQSPTATAAETDSVSIDVSLATSPLPTLSLAFPALDGEREISVKISVGLNGEVAVCGTVGEAGVVEAKVARRWARALQVCGVVGVWVEWVRGEVGA
ncbi:hypothetical protein Q7P37_001970 [Cladosporium fusiforme]